MKVKLRVPLSSASSPLAKTRSPDAEDDDPAARIMEEDENEEEEDDDEDDDDEEEEDDGMSPFLHLKSFPMCVRHPDLDPSPVLVQRWTSS